MFEKVLLAVDGSEHSRKAVPVAIDIARKSNGEVLIYHVRQHERVRGTFWEDEEKEEADEVVERVRSEVASAGVKARTLVERVLIGHVAQAIVDAATDNSTDLIVMGSRGLSDLRGLMVGSVTHKVLHLADRPVLVAR